MDFELQIEHFEASPGEVPIIPIIGPIIGTADGDDILYDTSITTTQTLR